MNLLATNKQPGGKGGRNAEDGEKKKQRETIISSQSQGRGKAAANRGRVEDAGEKPGAGQCGSQGWELLGHWQRGTRPPGPNSGGAWGTGAAERLGPGAETDPAQRSVPWAAPVCRNTPPALPAAAGGCRLLPSYLSVPNRRHPTTGSPARTLRGSSLPGCQLRTVPEELANHTLTSMNLHKCIRLGECVPRWR